MKRVITITYNDFGISWGPAIHFLELWNNFAKNNPEITVIGISPSWTKRKCILNPLFNHHSIEILDVKGIRQVIYDFRVFLYILRYTLNDDQVNEVVNEVVKLAEAVEDILAKVLAAVAETEEKAKGQKGLKMRLNELRGTNKKVANHAKWARHFATQAQRLVGKKKRKTQNNENALATVKQKIKIFLWMTVSDEDYTADQWAYNNLIKTKEQFTAQMKVYEDASIDKDLYNQWIKTKAGKEFICKKKKQKKGSDPDSDDDVDENKFVVLKAQRDQQVMEMAKKLRAAQQKQERDDRRNRKQFENKT
jgi:hypothetical protein